MDYWKVIFFIIVSIAVILMFPGCNTMIRVTPPQKKNTQCAKTHYYAIVATDATTYQTCVCYQTDILLGKIPSRYFLSKRLTRTINCGYMTHALHTFTVLLHKNGCLNSCSDTRYITQLWAVSIKIVELYAVKTKQYTPCYSYDAINFRQNHHWMHHIGPLFGWFMGCP